MSLGGTELYKSLAEAAPTLVNETEVLNEGGALDVDDFSPLGSNCPPTFDGAPDAARIRWLTRPTMLATEVRVAADMAVVVARRTTR